MDEAVASAAEEIAQGAAKALGEDLVFRLRRRMDRFDDGFLQGVEGLEAEARDDVIADDCIKGGKGEKKSVLMTTGLLSPYICIFKCTRNLDI